MLNNTNKMWSVWAGYENWFLYWIFISFIVTYKRDLIQMQFIKAKAEGAFLRSQCSPSWWGCTAVIHPITKVSFSGPLYIVFVFKCVINNNYLSIMTEMSTNNYLGLCFLHSECPKTSILTLLFSPKLKCVFFITARASAVKHFLLWNSFMDLA